MFFAKELISLPLEHESYLLNRSPQFSLSTGAENRTDLTLTPNPAVHYSAIVGSVLAGATPLLNALVKVMTQSGNPLDHQYTNSEGAYITAQFPAGVYLLVASAPGYLTSAPVTVNLPADSAAFVDFNLTADPRALLNNLYGLVLDQVTGNRLANATVILTDTQGQTLATTLTNSDGQYLLCETENGSYLLSAEKTGYALPVPLSITVTGGQLAQTNITLTPEVVTEGTVQGFIRDPGGNALQGACVGLYAVSGSTETLVQTTFTNAEGFYLFGNVLAGNYLVKAKVDTIE